MQTLARLLDQPEVLWGMATAPDALREHRVFELDGHLARIDVPADQTNSTLMFTWETNRVSFRSQRGSFSNNPSPANVISNWTYALAVPPTSDENVRLNLWLFNGAAPTDNQEVEVVISSFQFVPLGVPQPAWLTTAVQLGFIAGTLAYALLNLADAFSARRVFALSALFLVLAAGSVATRDLPAAHSFICRWFSVSESPSRFLMVLEHCSQSVFKAKSKATLAALVRIFSSFLTRWSESMKENPPRNTSMPPHPLFMCGSVVVIG